MKNWKTILPLLLLAALLSAVSHRALSNRPVDLLFLKAGDKGAEAYHLQLFLNGREPVVETLMLDSVQRKRAAKIIAKRDPRGLEEFARELGDFRFLSAVRTSPEGWPWYLGGEMFFDDAVSNLSILDKWYLALMTKAAPSPRYGEEKASGGREEEPALAAGGGNVELHPEDWIESHPLNRPTKAPESAENGNPAVKVEILNDCGITGIADGIARALTRPGVEIVYIGNTPRFKRRLTFIQSSVGIPVALQEILQLMGIAPEAVEEVPAGRRKADVSVIVGRDYKKILERMRDRTPE